MRRAELEHVLRAAAAVTEDADIVVIGSQAILGQFPDAPEALPVSREADVYPRNQPERSDEIDGSLGDGSYFDAASCVAGRQRDREFAEEALRHGLAKPAELRRRVGGLPLAGERLEAVERVVEGVIARVEGGPR